MCSNKSLSPLLLLSLCLIRSSLRPFPAAYSQPANQGVKCGPGKGKEGMPFQPSSPCRAKKGVQKLRRATKPLRMRGTAECLGGGVGLVGTAGLLMLALWISKGGNGWRLEFPEKLRGFGRVLEKQLLKMKIYKQALISVPLLPTPSLLVMHERLVKPIGICHLMAVD
jgi:hypothetical protein